jgi:hypothetical protein
MLLAVLRCELGTQLGLIWENEMLSVLLVGNLARFEARAIVVAAQASSFPTVDLAFAWTQATNVPLIPFLSFRITDGRLIPPRPRSSNR